MIIPVVEKIKKLPLQTEESLKDAFSLLLGVEEQASFFLHLLDGHSITQNGRWIPTKADYREIYQKMPKGFLKQRQF